MSRSNRHTLRATVLKRLDTLRLLRGFDRKAHFAAGGTPADWRGTHGIRPDLVKENDKQFCREDVETEEWENEE